ncbi:probable RNA polymerase II nuclear localization protein SLC7A6OS [Bombyx mandarina]|uniref:Probable RNA polymerase II nuclear localization protein SLC7A6OS n=1 Tax=Bombyx mandarina TaxID=7092 RepID=A0A6J2JE62_BOMMA|nr:probable RNA polymerase II nuclear localization protein SLC7A6OS [Bombyx mandarina]
MSSQTVIRVKRRLEDNPHDALVVTCKRPKTDPESCQSLFVFRATITNQETADIKDLVSPADSKLQPRHNVKDIVEKLRKDQKASSSKSRYEIVNCNRSIEKDTDNFNLVDLQKTDDVDDGIEYAYDLYTIPKQDFDLSVIDSFASIETDLILGTHDDGCDTTSGDEVDDDDDSNDENNWRNDYPDSEKSSIDEDDIVRAMERVDLEDNLSSDDGEDKIYDTNDYEENVRLYGTGYAKYKAKILAENPDLSNRSLIHSVKMKDIDEESVEGYKDDSDDGFYYGQEDDSPHHRKQYKDSSDEYSPD